MSRKFLSSAMCAVLLPVLIASAMAQATGAPPKKKPPAAPAKPSGGVNRSVRRTEQKPPAAPTKPSAEEPDNPFSVGPADNAAKAVPSKKAPAPGQPAHDASRRRLQRQP